MLTSSARSCRFDKQVQSARHCRRPLRRPGRLSVESLEERLMLNADEPDVISVGRFLSAWSAADVQNDELRITYTVFNQQNREVSDVVLMTELQPDVTFSNASLPPDINGQELTWNFGTIRPLGYASVEVTVSLGSVMAQDIDFGASASGVAVATLVSDDAPPAALRDGPIAPDLLASTPDANATDPFIRAKAAELNQDSDTIFAFMTQEIGYESYVGSLRGARGTLWSSAGNALDEASLMIALLRSSGVPAQYVAGTLADAEAQQLILSMFPNNYRTVGLVPAGAPVADPANDPQLLAETRAHFWVQFDVGVGFEDADPTFRDAMIGQTFTSPDSTFSEVPDNLRHKITVRLDRELAIPATSLLTGGGSPLSRATVLEQTFNTAELVGKPLSISHFVDQQDFNLLVFTSKTNTYTPFLAVGDEALPLEQSHVILGTSYQEMITNYPLGLQLLTGLFLQAELSGPAGPPQVFERTLVDRIGFDVRQNGGTPDLPLDADTPPLVTDLDVFTLLVMPGLSNPRQSNALPERLNAIADAFEVLPDEDPTGEATFLARSASIGLTRFFGDLLGRFSDIHTEQFANSALVRAYADQPRLAIVSSRTQAEDAGATTLAFSIDLRRDTIRVVPFPGQNAEQGPLAFHVGRGLFENIVEQRVLALGPATPVPPGETSTAIIFEEAEAAGVPITSITRGTLARLDNLVISAEAKARITLAADAGKLVLVPSQSVLVSGSEAIGWYEIDLASGETIGVSENGGHQGLIEFATALFLDAVTQLRDEYIAKAKGAILGIAAGEFLSTAHLLCVISEPESGACAVETAAEKADVISQVERMNKIAEVLGLPAVNQETFENIFKKTLRGFTGIDPAVPPALADPNPPSPFPTNVAVADQTVPATAAALQVFGSPAAITADQNSPATFDLVVETNVADTYTLRARAPAGWTVHVDASGIVSVTPASGLQGGTFPVRISARSQSDPTLVASNEVMVTVTATSSGVTLDIVPDPLFYVETGGAQLPTAFRAVMQNLGPVEDTFDLTFPSLPAGFELRASRSSVTIPPGQTAIIGMYLFPTGPLPAPGTDASFSVQSTSQTDGAITDTESELFLIPAVHGVALFADPAAVTTSPGTAVETILRIESHGNVAESVTFDVSPSAGLTVDGLQPLILSPGEVGVLTLTLTPEADAPLNATLASTIRASFGGPDPATLTISAHVAVPGVESITRAAAALDVSGNSDLANRLDDLGLALTNLVQDLGNPVFKSQALASLDSILSQLTVNPALDDFIGSIQTARDALEAAATPTDVLEAVNDLGDVFDDFAAVAINFSQHNFELFLSPNSQVAQPLVPREFAIQLHNIGTQPTTYDLAVGGVPGGVTSQLSDTSVTLDRDEFATVTLTLTQSTGDELLAFNFTVDVAASGVTPAITKSITGSLRTRREFVSVTSVDLDLPFVDPGDQVAMSARLLNAVNQQRDALVSFVVKDSAGQTVFSSTPVATQLSVQTSLVTVNLGSVDTTGFALGQHTIIVTVADTNNNPIPGGTGRATLLVGSPVSASLIVGPQLLPPGTSTVINTLEINALADVGDPLTVVGHLPIDSFKRFFDASTNDVLHGLALNLDDGRLYVFGNNGFHVVNAGDPTNPIYVRNKAFQGFTNGIVNAGGDALIVVGPGPNTNIVAQARGSLDFIDLSGIFGTADNPGRINGTSFAYQGAGEAVLLDGPIEDHLFVPNLLVRFNPANNDIFSQNGTVLSFSVDRARAFNPNIFVLEDALLNENGTTNDATFFENGGNFNIFDAALVNAQTLYATSTTSTGTNTQAGVGRILVVDISDPDNINSDPPNTSKIVATLDIPGTVQLHGIATEGNLAFVVGTQGGWRDPFVDVNDIGPTGNLVLATVDISDARNPQLIHSEVIPRSARGGGDNIISLGAGRFAFSSLGQFDPADTPQLFVVDASDPADIAIVEQLDLPGQIRGLKTLGDFLYATGDDGLTIYRLGGDGDIPVTASVHVPNGTGVEVVPGSFNVAPTNIITGPDFDTLVWDTSLSAIDPTRTFTWQTTVTGLQPGEARDVTGDTTIDFTFQMATDQIALPPEDVFAEQILSMTPAAITVQPGEEAMYSVTLTNPLPTAVTYQLAVTGVPQDWVNSPTSVLVGAGSSSTFSLRLTSDPFATPGDYGFVVTASTSSGIAGAVEATLTLAGEPVLPDVATDARGVLLAMEPPHAFAGQGDAVELRLRITNTGSVTEAFSLSVDMSLLPPGAVAMFSEDVIEISPGANNFREFTLTVIPPVGTALLDYPVVVDAVTEDSELFAQVSSPLTVLDLGVDVEITPASGGPDMTYDLMVTNTGQVTDTYDLSIAGPAALAAMLAASSVTLDAGQSQSFPIDVGSIETAFVGGLSLIGYARSRTHFSVQDMDEAAVDIEASSGMTAEFDPPEITLPVPGPASFLLRVENLGNLEDQYTAKIITSTGAITASLIGLDGTPTQVIPRFHLPGLANGAIRLEPNLSTPGQGTVTVRITSLTDGTIVAEATATLVVEQPTNSPPEITSNGGGDTASIDVPENTTAVTDVNADDPDAGTTLTFSIIGGADAAKFSISATSGVLTFNSAPNFESPTDAGGNNVYDVIVQVSDGSLIDTQAIAVTVTNSLELQSFDVQRGATQRSFVRNIDLVFDDPAALQGLLDGGRIQLTKFDLNGNNGASVGLAGRVTRIGAALAIDFGVQGIGGNRNSNAGDGYYRFRIDTDGDGAFETIRSFYRLFGDVTGDHIVSDADVAAIGLALGRSGPDLAEDTNGDGVVNALDRLFATRAKGRRLLDGLILDD